MGFRKWLNIFSLTFHIWCIGAHNMFSTIISIKITENVISNCHKVFAMSEVHLYMHYSQSLESTKNFNMQYSLRYLSTFERVVIAWGLFRSSLFISGLTLFGLRNYQLWVKAYVHASYVLYLLRIKYLPSQLFAFF